MKTLNLNKNSIEILPDDRLATEVDKALAYYFWIPKDRVHAHVKDGWVIVDGSVEWLFQKSYVEDVVSRIPGIRGIVSNIHLEDSDTICYYPHGS